VYKKLVEVPVKSSNEGSLKERLKFTEVWFKLALLLVFGLLFILAIPYPEKSKQFPQLLAAVSLILIVISLLKDFIRKGKVAEGIADVDDTELKVPDPEARIAKRRRLYRAWEIILVSTALGFLGGFLFTSFFLFIGFAFFFGERKNLLKNILIAVFMTVIIFLSFQMVMGVPLLSGLLW
jgi:hypothetical protein